MKQHKIAPRIILLILSVINFALAAPISLERGTREVRTDVVDTAEDVTTVSRKRWLPSDEWSTNAADRANAPQDPAPSGSEESLEPGPGSPTVYSSVWSNDFDDFRPLPVGSPPPAHHDNNMPLTLEMYLNQLDAHPHLALGLGLPAPSSPPPAHHDLPLNPPPGSPQPSPGLADQDNTRPLPVGSPPPAHDDMPVTLDMFFNHIDALFRLGLGMIDSDSPPPQAAHDNLLLKMDSNAPPGPPRLNPGPTDQDNSHPLPVGPPTPAHNKLPLDLDLNVPLQPSQGPIDDQPPPASPSDPGSSKRPYPFDDLDPRPSKTLYRPSDPGPSTWAHPALYPGPSSWALPPSDPGSSTWAHPASNPGPSTWAHPPPDPEPRPDPDPPPDQAQGPSTPHPPSSPGPQQHKSEIIFSDLFKSSRLKRRISRSPFANAGRAAGNT